MKIISIFVCVLLIAATIVPVIGTVDLNKTKVEKQSTIDNEKTPSTSFDIDWWPSLHHDIQNTRFSTSPAPNTNHKLWSYETGDLILLSSPAVVDNKLYIGTWGPMYIDESDFLDVLQGNKKSLYEWSQFFVKFVDFAHRNKASFQEWPGKVYCLDAVTGNHIWDFTTEGFVIASPTVYDDKVYISSLDVDYDFEVIRGTFYCLDAADGDVIWSNAFGEWAGVPGSSAVVVDGKVYIPSISILFNETEYYIEGVEGKFYCLDADDGHEIWNYTFGEWEGVLPGSSPAVADGKVYIPFVKINIDTEMIWGKFLCLDADVGDVIWSHTFGLWTGVLCSSPALANGKVYIPSALVDPYMEHLIGRFYCLDAEDGDVIWSYTFGDWEGALPGSSPAVADGKVYIPSVFIDPYMGFLIGRFYCLDAEDGDVIWSYIFGEWEGVPGSSPAIADGKVYIPTITVDIDSYVVTGTIYAFGGSTELDIQNITGGLNKVSAEIINVGDNDAENIVWSITVEGGLFDRINVASYDIFDILEVDSMEKVSTDKFIFGLGGVEITVRADADNAIEATVRETGFVLGPFIIIRR